jgi:hypothetical protein
MNKILPSYDLTPSKAFNNPEKDTDLPSFLSDTLVLSTNIASTSARRIIDLLGVVSKSLFRPSSSKEFPDKFKVQIFNPNFPATAKIKEVFPVPGGPYNR